MSSNTEYLAKQLNKYNWSGDKDYQLAVIAFREILEAHESTLKAEYEERLPEYHVKTKGAEGMTVTVEGKEAFDFFIEAITEEKVRQARSDAMYEVVGHLHIVGASLNGQQSKALADYMEQEGLSITQLNTPKNGEPSNE